MKDSERKAIANINLNLGELESVWLTFRHVEGESILCGNAEGLVLLADQLLGLAATGKAGSHLHFSKGSPLDQGNCELTVVYEDPGS